MTAVDSNILIYAHRVDSPFHAVSKAALVSFAEGGVPWAIAWPSIHEFLAIVTHPKIFRPPTPLFRALADLDTLFESPSLRMIGEPADYWAHLRSLLSEGEVAGPVVHDARIAAICRSHGVHTILSADRDFSRFPGLKIRNPLKRP